MAGINVKMPDGTVINNVPEGTTQEQLLQMYSSHKAATLPKYQASDETVYDPMGVPLITPQGIEPGSAGAAKARDVLTDVAGAPVRAAMSVAKPIASVAEMLGTSQPSKAIQAIDTGVKEQTGPISTGASIAGDIGAFGGATKAGMAGLQMLRGVPQVGNILSKIQGAYQALPAVGKLSAAGAGSSLLSPIGKSIDEPGYAQERAEQAGFSAVAGPIIGKGLSAVAGVAAPKLEQLKELARQGIDINKFVKGPSTLGQVLGGGTQALENFLSVFPLAGIRSQAKAGNELLESLKFDKNIEMDRAKAEALNKLKTSIDDTFKLNKEQVNAENQALADRLIAHTTKQLEDLNAKHSEFSLPVLKRTLSQLGEDLPPDLKGTDLIKHISDRVKNKYDEALSGIGELRIGDAQEKLLQKVGDKFSKTEGIQQEVDNLINLAGDTRLITPQQWQAELSELGQKAYSAATTGGLKGVQQAKALRELKDAWMQLAEDTVGGDLIKQANRAHAEFQPAEKAAGYLSSIKRGGEFNPDELLRGIKASMPSRKFARGDDPLLKDTLKAYEQMAKERAALEAQHAKWNEQLKKVQAENNKQLAARKAELNEQKRVGSLDINEKNKVAKKELATAVGDVKAASTPGSLLSRLGYATTLGLGVGALGGKGLAAVSPMAGAIGSALTTPAAGVALIGPASKLLYSMPSQLYKQASVAERPKAVEAAGRLLRQQLPKATGAATVSSMPAQPGAIPQNVQNAYEDATWEAPEGQRAGGLVHLR